MPLDEGGLHERGGKGRIPFRKALFYVISSSNVKIVANRHRHAAYHNKHRRRAS